MLNVILFEEPFSTLKSMSEETSKNSVPTLQRSVNSIVGILNLPTELKQNIALRLNSKDYGSFRETCLAIQQDIDSFSVLSNKIKSKDYPDQGREGITKILLNQSVRMMVAGGQWGGVKQVLKNVGISKYRTSDNSLLMSTVFSTPSCHNDNSINEGNICPCWVKKGFMLFKNEISEFIDIQKVTAFRRRRYQKIYWVVGVAFKNEFIHYSQLKTVFINLNQVFNQVYGGEKLLIAVIADKLKSFLEQNIPHGLVKNDIAESARGAEELFTIANEVKRML